MGTDSLMDRFDVVVCDHCGMDTCEVVESNGECESSCSLCGFEKDSSVENTPSDDAVSTAVILVNVFKEWAERRGVEEPSAYAVMKSVEDGASMWMNLEVLNSGCSCVEDFGNVEGVKDLEKESEKIFNFFYSDECYSGILSITEKVEVGKEGMDLIEYIVG